MIPTPPPTMFDSQGIVDEAMAFVPSWWPIIGPLLALIFALSMVSYVLYLIQTLLPVGFRAHQAEMAADGDDKGGDDAGEEGRRSWGDRSSASVPENRWDPDTWKDD